MLGSGAMLGDEDGGIVGAALGGPAVTRTMGRSCEIATIPVNVDSALPPLDGENARSKKNAAAKKWMSNESAHAMMYRRRTCSSSRRRRLRMKDLFAQGAPHTPV